MIEIFKTINNNCSHEIVEKKSRFIANIFPVSSEKQAQEIILKVKKENIQARHNVFAYRIIEDEKIIDRFSDDSEPTGTAGIPILNLLIQKELANVLVVVTRYFGGILLGTGGLFKAYSDSAKGAIEKSIITIKELRIFYKNRNRL